MSGKGPIPVKHPRPKRSVKIGDYTLGKVLGVGSFSTVRLATHSSTGQQYAVKVLDKRKMDLDLYETQVSRECNILQALDHPNIVRVKRVLKSKMCAYIFLEYLEGGELFDEIVSQTRLNEEKSRNYFRQLTSALSHAHARHIMHRDIKPENILLDKERENIKITDFGMGWMREHQETTEAELENDVMTTPCGTPKYMPPELLGSAERGYCAAKLDVWSCGMVLFACLAGYLPYSGETGDPTVILEQINNRESIEFPSWFSEEVCDLITRALEKDPSKRINMSGLRNHVWTVGFTGSPLSELSLGVVATVSGKCKTGAGRRTCSTSALQSSFPSETQVATAGEAKAGQMAVKSSHLVPPIILDGSMGIESLDFTSPITPTTDEFALELQENSVSSLYQRIDLWEI